MDDRENNLPLDARLLTEAIIEINIARHNTSMYPKDHPIVKKSLDRALMHLNKLFEFRASVTIAIAKDTIIIDDYHLDKKNAVFREFALSLNQQNIARITLKKGLTKDEIYALQKFLQLDLHNPSSEETHREFAKFNFHHLEADFIDYSAFNIVEDDHHEQGKEDGAIWERYIFGLLEGSLQGGDVTKALHNIAPAQLAGVINRTSLDKFREDSYDRIITSYMRESSERAFSTSDLKKILDFIEDLRPELKSQFLSASVGSLTKELDSVNDILKKMTSDDVLNLLSLINEQMIVIPEALKNVLSKFSHLNRGNAKYRQYGGSLIEDDFVLSPEITSLLAEADFKVFVSETYQKEIERLIMYDARNIKRDWLSKVEHQWEDEHIEGTYHHVMLELMSTGDPALIAEEDYEFYRETLIEQMTHFMNTGQYGQMIFSFATLEANIEHSCLQETTSKTYDHFHSPLFMTALVDSFRGIGRRARDDVHKLCRYYGEKIIPPLINALIEEESSSVRRFIIDLIAGFGDAAASEALRRMKDTRWFVKRNMLFILIESGSTELLKEARPYCNHENPQVSFEATKCLLKAGDDEGVQSLRKWLRAASAEHVKKAVSLAGAFSVQELVPELLQLLRKKALTGSDFDEKIPVVHALGQIGDEQSRPYLEHILASKSFLYKGALEKLQREVRKTLKHYFEERKMTPDSEFQKYPVK